MTGRRTVGSLVAAAGVLLASCTTVPNSSSPQVVRSVGVDAPGPQETIRPNPGADARSMVAGFLDANAANDPNHNSARSFLTPEEKNRWGDTTITVIDRAFVGNLVRNTVTVRGNQIGTVDVTGLYTPVLLGDGTGTGGVPVAEPFGMKRVKGEWRINSVSQKGLLITAQQFQKYQQRVLYFFDSAGERLVPDPRYTQLVAPKALAVWLISRLAQGPRGGLSSALPEQTNPKRVPVLEFPRDDQQGAPIKIEIPGAAELGTVDLDRLGAQLSVTLGQIGQIGDMEITDSGKPVRIPVAGGTTFTAGLLAGQFDTTAPASKLYYINGGGVYEASGRRLPGKVGAGVYGLTSVALTPRLGSTVLQIAGVRGVGKNEILDIGTPDQLFATKVHGELSRPAWAPGANEVWIGAGTNLYRVSPARTVHPVPLDAQGGKASGRVTAVRLSPEGARVALVLTSNGVSQVYVGAVVRSTTGVRVAGLLPISPQGVSVVDVAWNDQLKLFTIGTDLRTGNFGVYEVQCDGSVWTLRPSGLPQAPDSVTVAANSVAVVSTGGTVERQQASSWEGLTGDETRGTNPVYLE